MQLNYCLNYIIEKLKYIFFKYSQNSYLEDNSFS